MASAKLAKITVRNSQMVMDQVKVPGWAMASMKVMTVPTSTTNMTGLRTCTAGFSFLNESTRAWRRISPSNRPRASATPWGLASAGLGLGGGVGHGHQKNFRG
jgi:hypothetical protein